MHQGSKKENWSCKALTHNYVFKKSISLAKQAPRKKKNNKKNLQQVFKITYWEIQ